MSALKWLEIRALGELGPLDEMIAAYASAASVLPARDLPFCRLYVLAQRTHRCRPLSFESAVAVSRAENERLLDVGH